MSGVRMLGLCGLLASALSLAGGFADCLPLVGASGAVMLLGNVYALAVGQ